MPLSTTNDLPPIFAELLRHIQAKQEQQEYINLQDFKRMLYNIRFSKEGVDAIEKWMRERGIIERVQKNTIILLQPVEKES